MEKHLFGTLPTGEEIYYCILSGNNTKVHIMTRGAAILRLIYDGVDVVGGFETLDEYLEDTSHQGALIGRIANRVENAQFKLGDKIYNLPKNDNGNCLHGGDGFDHKVFRFVEITENTATLEYTSPDGEEGFPSELLVRVKYTLIDDALMIEYTAIPDGDTPISLTNHSYFNLDGFGGTIEEHEALIYANEFTAVNDLLIPTGEHPSVNGTPFDFTTPRKIGERCSKDFIGYDHNFVLSPTVFKDFLGKKLGLATVVSSNSTEMSVYTDQPGIQFYIGNFLGNGPAFRGNKKQVFHGAFCLETQTEPNSVNSGIGIYGKGDVYTHTTVYEFKRNS